MHNLKNNSFKILVIITAYFSAFEMFANPSFYVNNTEIVGSKAEDVDIYLGIPYAEPPIGSLRWEVTQPKVFQTKDSLQINLHLHACKVKNCKLV